MERHPSGRVLGVGMDLVAIEDFAAALAAPGTRMRAAFTATEHRQAGERTAHRGGRDPLRHLAARWAAKEAAVKAWSEALYGHPPPLPVEELDWSWIGVVCDAWGRPALRLADPLEQLLRAGLGPCRWNVSLTHEDRWAAAHVVLSAV